MAANGLQGKNERKTNVGGRSEGEKVPPEGGTPNAWGASEEEKKEEPPNGVTYERRGPA